MDARGPTEWLSELTELALRPNERTKRLPQNQEYLEQGMGKETDENAEVERGRSSRGPARGISTTSASRGRRRPCPC